MKIAAVGSNIGSEICCNGSCQERSSPHVPLPERAQQGDKQCLELQRVLFGRLVCRVYEREPPHWASPSLHACAALPCAPPATPSRSIWWGLGFAPAAMPNSVFGRFRRQTQDSIGSSGVTSPPPSSAGFGLATNTSSLPSFVPEEQDGDVSPTNTTAAAHYGIFPEPNRDRDIDRSKHSGGHKRDSSILSLGSGVQGLRRSVSLRSHRSQSSTSPYGHRSRQSSHLSTHPLSPDDLSLYQSGQSQTRKKPSISTFPFAKQAKSLENLTLLSPTFDSDAPPPPSLNRLDLHAKNSFPMLVGGGPASLRRHPSDRPSVSSQGVGSANGAPLQPAPTIQSVSLNGQNPSAVYQSILETTQKRMATIEYLKKVHEGDVYYLSTLHYPPGSVSALPSMHPHKLGRRSTSYFLLGYSLPALLELNSGSPMEYLKALISLLHEFETYQNLSGTDSAGNSLGRGRMGQMFKSGMGLGKSSSKGRRSSTATESFGSDSHGGSFSGFPSSGMGSPQEVTSPVNAFGHDFQNLLTPSLPFDPDFGTTFATLCETMIETYSNLLNLITTPDLCSPSVGEAFAKADKSVRKILVANVMREFEETTRTGIRGEVAGLGKLVLGGLM